MLTFLELYQTLLGFVFYKLYTDAGLMYPPSLDAKKYEAAAGVGAFCLQETGRSSTTAMQKHKTIEIDGRKISGRDVRQTIKTITTSAEDMAKDSLPYTTSFAPEENQDEDFVPHLSKSMEPDTSLPTFRTLESLLRPLSTKLFTPYTFFLSREISRSIFEFLIRSFGGRVGWPASSGDGSPIDEDDPSITHVIIDRPVAPLKVKPAKEQEWRLRRKFVQPQWIVDCINSGKILLEEPYAQGRTLPPHLSPFGEYEGAYDPTTALLGTQSGPGDSESEEERADEDEADKNGETSPNDHLIRRTLDDATENPSTLRTAELAAEAAGMNYDAFEREVSKLGRKIVSKQQRMGDVEEEDMNKMMMTNKQRKLYEKMRYSEKRKESEVRV